MTANEIADVLRAYHQRLGQFAEQVAGEPISDTVGYRIRGKDNVVLPSLDVLADEVKKLGR